MKRLATLALCATALSASAQDIRLSADNIDEVMAAMTLEEKARLLVGQPGYERQETNRGYCVGAAGATRAIPRLGIPAVVLSDGPAGVRIAPTREGTDQTFYATGFPVGICLASTWNTQLVEQVGQAIGNEVLEYGCDVLLAPGMNIHRTPLCGRNFEYYSEDPLLTGRIASAYVCGVQSQGVGTSVKHYAVNSQETNRLQVDEEVSRRALREIYLKGFEIAIRESEPWTVMSSYNKLNGTWTQSSPHLLKTILRDEWHYPGVVMTDWTGADRPSYERTAAGNELLMPGNDVQINDIISHVKDGTLPMSEVDARIRALLQFIVRTPHFRGYRYSNKPDLQAHALIPRQSATEGMVLLENRGALPLAKDVKRIALFGTTSYDFIAGGTGSGDVNKPYVIDLRTGLENAGYTLSSELVELYEAHKALTLAERRAQGNRRTGRIPELAVNPGIIQRQAGQADIAVITIGRQAGEGADRRVEGDFNLTDAERSQLQQICDAFHARGKQVVVILNMGNAIETASWKHLPDALLMAWQPGQEGGNSVASVLSGEASPSGRLSMTFPLSIGDIPAAQNFPNGPGYNHGDRRRNTDYTLHEEGIYVGYRYFVTAGRQVSYPFGYGLSYTTFQYSKPRVSRTSDGLAATFTVTNTGQRASKEVVQLYVSAPLGSLTDKPARELKAFAKTRTLQPGESETLTMPVDLYTLASFNEQASAWQTASGTYDIQFGASCDDIRARVPFRLSKAQSWSTHDVLAPHRKMQPLVIK